MKNDLHEQEENPMATIPITVKGEAQLRAELSDLKSVQRPRIIQAISEARAHGDLKENAEYHAAKEQQAFTEGRIQDIETKLSNCTVIDISKINNEGKVIFGSTVTLVNEENSQEVIYQIVGDDEADIKLGKVSVNAPVARALIGKFEGDSVQVTTPQGQSAYEIVKVEYK